MQRHVTASYTIWGHQGQSLPVLARSPLWACVICLHHMLFQDLCMNFRGKHPTVWKKWKIFSPFSFFSLPSAFCPPKEAKRIGELPRIHAEKNSKKYQPALNSYFSHKGRVGASGPRPFSGKSQKGTRMRSGKGSRGGRGRVGVWGQALVTNEECYAEESRSWNTFVLPIWWGCNYRRIELTRHGGPFPLTFTSFLCNNLWEKS